MWAHRCASQLLPEHPRVKGFLVHTKTSSDRPHRRCVPHRVIVGDQCFAELLHFARPCSIAGSLLQLKNFLDCLWVFRSGRVTRRGSGVSLVRDRVRVFLNATRKGSEKYILHKQHDKLEKSNLRFEEKKKIKRIASKNSVHWLSAFHTESVVQHRSGVGAAGDRDRILLIATRKGSEKNIWHTQNAR